MSKDMLGIAVRKLVTLQASTLGTVCDLLEKLSDPDWVWATKRFLRKEDPWPDAASNGHWYEENGMIRSSVTSDCRTGPEWVVYFEERGIHLSDWAKDLLLSDDFQPTSGVTTEIAILKGNLFSDDDCVTSKIRAKATELGFTKPNAEVACLIREKFSDKQIEAIGLLWIIVMHKPIQDSSGVPSLLGVSCDDDEPWLLADCDSPGCGWGRGGGFAFVLP